MKILITLTIDTEAVEMSSMSTGLFTFMEERLRGPSFRQLLRDALGEFRAARGHEAPPTAHGDGVETYVATRYAQANDIARSNKVNEVRDRIALATELLRNDFRIEWTSK